MRNLDKIRIIIKSELQEAEKSSTSSEKCERLNNVIQLKLHSNEDILIQDLYNDIKKFIAIYIDALEEKRSDYDVFDTQKIVGEFIKKTKGSERIDLLKFLIRTLKLKGFEEYVEDLQSELSKEEFKFYFRNFKVKHLLKLTYLGITYNSVSIIFSLGFSFLLYYLVLLPAPKWSVELFNLSYVKYSDIFFYNHFLNLLSSFFFNNTAFKIEPINSQGVLLAAIGKLLFVVIVVNVLINQFYKRIKV